MPNARATKPVVADQIEGNLIDAFRGVTQACAARQPASGSDAVHRCQCRDRRAGLVVVFPRAGTVNATVTLARGGRYMVDATRAGRNGTPCILT